MNETAADSITPVKVDIWSDVQCPWCYIGKRRFEAAVDSSGVAVEIEYHSFELAPDTPVEYEGTPLQFLSERKGLPMPQVEDLADIAASIGFDRDEVVNALESSEYLPAVKADMEVAMQYGIQGVPFFVIDGKYGVSGAQESETFANVLTQVLTERDA